MVCLRSGQKQDIQRHGSFELVQVKLFINILHQKNQDSVQDVMFIIPEIDAIKFVNE